MFHHGGAAPQSVMSSESTKCGPWYLEWLDQPDGDFPDDFWKESYYIADSALIAEPALTKIRASVCTGWVACQRPLDSVID